MTSPPSLSSFGLPTSFSNYSNSQSFQRSNPRGKGQPPNHRRGGRGNHYGGGPSHRGGFKYDGRSNTGYNRGSNGGQQGDMKTGLFRDSFLEDPWKDLVPRKTVPGGKSVLLDSSSFGQSMEDDGSNLKGEARESEENSHDRDGEGEGEIILPDSNEDNANETAVGPGIGLGDGLVEAAREAQGLHRTMGQE